LTNFFNTLPRRSAHRLPVYNAILDLANTNNELQVLQVSRADVEKLLKEREITPSEKSAFLERLVNVFSKVGQPSILCLSPLHLLTPIASLSVQRHGLLLQVRTRPLAKPRIAGDTVRCARRDRHGPVQPDHLRL